MVKPETIHSLKRCGGDGAIDNGEIDIDRSLRIYGRLRRVKLEPE